MIIIVIGIILLFIYFNKISKTTSYIGYPAGIKMFLTNSDGTHLVVGLLIDRYQGLYLVLVNGGIITTSDLIICCDEK